jgi:hypothetical protein
MKLTAKETGFPGKEGIFTFALVGVFTENAPVQACTKAEVVIKTTKTYGITH